MLLTHARIQDFRCIEDSDEFRVDQVTSLVGKNESGKTSILHALRRLNEDEKFIASRDYPKRKWKPGVAVPNDPSVLQTKWKLEPADLKAIEKEHGPGVVTSEVVAVTKAYDNVRRWTVQVDEGAIVKFLIAKLATPGGPVQFSSKATTLAQLTTELTAIAARDAEQETVLQTLQTTYKDGASGAVRATLKKRIPTFLYFDQYLRLPGEVAIDALIQRKAQNQINDDDKIFLALISLAGTTPEAIHAMTTFEEFNAALRAVSNQITEKIFKYWTQNSYLDVDIRLDNARPSDPPPFNTGYIFRTRIANRRHRVDTSFADRSTGFVWFFSFLVWFNELRDTTDKNLIILLDEPGLTLHARAQADLLRYIRDELQPDHQVIYTTHSPFMIDPDRILSARTVEDVVQVEPKTKREVLVGTKVGQDVLSMDQDTVSPLQRALDYEMTQTLFVGRHTLLVEGESDFLYLRWFSQQLNAANRVGLDFRWALSIVRGVDRIPGFVALFRGNQLHVAAVVDVQQGDRPRREKAEKALQANHLLTLDTFTSMPEADIEDMLGRDLYVHIVNAAYNLGGAAPIVPAQAPAGAPIRVAQEVAAHFRSLPAHIPSTVTSPRRNFCSTSRDMYQLYRVFRKPWTASKRYSKH